MIITTGNARTMKKVNKAIVIDVIRRLGPISRVSIARGTGLNPSTVSNIVGELLEEGLVLEAGSEESMGGRKPITLVLNSKSGYVVGVELGDSGLAAVLINFTGKPIAREKIKFSCPTVSGVESAVDVVVDLVRSLGRKVEGKILGVGLGVAGLVDPVAGVSLLSPNLGWRNVPLRQMFKAKLDLPIVIDNDVKAMALGEQWFGSGRDVDDLVCVNVGAGVGTGVIMGGRIYRGFTGSAGEIGHSIVEVDGPLCRCGRKGCLESLVGGNAIVREAIEATRLGVPTYIRELVEKKDEQVTPEVVFQAAEAGDAVAVDILQKVGTYLGIGIANVVNAYDPQRVVLGGEICRSSDLVVETAKEVARQFIFSCSAQNTKIVMTELGEDAQAIGAATLVLQKHLNPYGAMLSGIG